MGLVSRLVNAGMNWNHARQFEELSEVEGASGWSNNAHGGSALALPAGVPTDYEVDGAVELISQKPADVPDFWAANKITGRTGDAIVGKAQFQCIPDDAVASNLNIKIDIGGSVGVVEEYDFPLVRGALVSHPITCIIVAYTLDTWEANGGRIILTADGDCTIPAAGRRVFLNRLHKAR